MVQILGREGRKGRELRRLKPLPPKDTTCLKDAVLLGFAEHSQEWLCHRGTMWKDSGQDGKIVRQSEIHHA
jgi:hypothetical protein